MLSFKKAKWLFDRLKEIFKDEYDDSVLLMASEEIIKLAKDHHKSKKINNKFMHISNDVDKRNFANKSIDECIADDGWELMYREKNYSDPLINDDIDINMNRLIISQWFQENTI